MIKTRIEYKGNNHSVSVTRLGDILYAHITSCGRVVKTLTANIMKYDDVRRIAERIYYYLTGLSAPNPPCKILIKELQRIREYSD